MTKLTKEEAAAQDQKKVGKDGAQHGGLNNADLASVHRLDGDNDLHRIPERRIDQAPDDLIGVQRQFLSEVP